LEIEAAYCESKMEQENNRRALDPIYSEVVEIDLPLSPKTRVAIAFSGCTRGAAIGQAMDKMLLAGAAHAYGSYKRKPSVS
jgi:hypothetical protein